MNILKLLIFTSLFFLSLSSSAQTLWGKALVGDSILDIKKKYPTGIDIDEPISGIGDLSYKYILKKLNINDENFEAFFILSKKYGLRSIHIKSTGNYSLNDCQTVKNKTFGALRTKYGNPIDLMGLGAFFIWEINGVKINISDKCLHEKKSIEINYESMKENISSDNL